MLSVKYGAGWADWMKQYTEITGHQDHRQQGSGQQLDPSILYSLSQLLLRIRNASQSRSRKIFKRKNIFLVFLLSSLIEKLSFWWKIFFNRWAVGDTLLLVICLDNSWARLKSQLNSKFCSFAWFLKDCKFSICKVLQMQVMFCEASILSTFCPSNL